MDSKCNCGVSAIVKEKDGLYCATCWIRKRFNFFKKEVENNANTKSVRNRESNNR